MQLTGLVLFFIGEPSLFFVIAKFVHAAEASRSSSTLCVFLFLSKEKVLQIKVRRVTVTYNSKKKIICKSINADYYSTKKNKNP
jgi:hypothetical protein